VTPRLLSTIGGMRIAIPPPRKRRGSPCYIFMNGIIPIDAEKVLSNSVITYKGQPFAGAKRVYGTP
jgi:hypothetical protein